MEIEPSPTTLIAKKMWNIVRIVFYMLRKGLSKSKLMLDLHLMLKRGKLASKNIGDLMLHHHYSTTISCGSTDVAMSLVYPREYEFSCSNSPVYPSYSSRKKHRHHHHHRHHQVEDLSVAQRVFDILSNYESVEASPMINLPGFGRSPLVRQLRVTDSPFSVRDVEENNPQVDKAAEDFIMKFKMELMKQQKRIESPSRYHA
ncbi:Avr9/Cf-9 rapidly elicited protein 146 [Heracleum sosnowskyi]|uniref:Avr9/Cf-9 rapidly elicited protein 146 n=1 Tax=Heracleum sosnowskyi TaxID=360622 RepID=A0AAD8HDT9_9APIA|nr:Avr9/Cf-9 rapidly elicited protein 146 [Heracleum sosnowskyi]